MTTEELLTHSRLDCYRTCPRKHYIRYELGIRLAGEEKKCLRRGQMIHEAIEDYRRNKTEFVFPEYPTWCITDEQKYDYDIEITKIVCILRGYFLRYENDTLLEIIEPEKVFKTSIKNPETGGITPCFQSAGKRDAIARYNGRLCLHEIKTTSQDISPDSFFWKRLRIDSQINHYWLGCKDEGFDIETVLYDVLRMPDIQPLTIPIMEKWEDGQEYKIVVDEQGNRVFNKNGKPRQTGGEGMTLKSRKQTPVEYEERLRADIQSRPDWYYCRKEIPRLSSDLEEYRHELWQIQQQIREAQKSGRWFRNTGACSKWNSPCEYFELCCFGNLDMKDFSEVDLMSLGFKRVEDKHPELNDEMDV